MHVKHFLPAFILAAFAASAAVPIVVDVETSETRTRYLDAFRGETVDLELHFRSYGEPMSFTNGTPAGVWWQTNGMGNAWWHGPAGVSTDGVARASWTPAMDCGADRYAFFVGVGGSDRSYRAAITVRMHGAPGPRPNEIAPPVQVLDFARIVVTNAPWSVVSGLTTNDVRAIIEDEGYLSQHSPWDATIKWRADDNHGQYLDLCQAGIKADWIGVDGPFGFAFLLNTEAEGNTMLQLPSSSGTIALTTDVPSTNGLATAEEVAQLRTDASLVYQLLVGSNVVAEVTNYNSRVHAPSIRLLQLDPETHDYITVWAETNGLSRTLASANAYSDAASNALDRAKADRAWSRHTSGLGADAPEGVTWISTPETVIAGGYEYSKHVTSHGEVWVLSSNGLSAGADTNSYFRVTAGDGETLFSIEKTDSVLVGVDADAISVSGGTVTIPLSVVSQDAPVCYATSDLVNAVWSNLTEDTPAWVTSAACTGTPGNWVWTIETTATRAFFQFRVLQPGATVIRNNAQTDLSQGILVNGVRFYPHNNNGTLTWTTTP